MYDILLKLQSVEIAGKIVAGLSVMLRQGGKTDSSTGMHRIQSTVGARYPQV